MAAVGRRRARVAGAVRGGVDDVLVVGQEIAAGGAALAGRDHVLIRAVGVHDVHLVALVRRARGLEDQPLAVGRPISLGILATVGELVDVAQMRIGGESGGREPAPAGAGNLIISPFYTAPAASIPKLHKYYDSNGGNGGY